MRDPIPPAVRLVALVRMVERVDATVWPSCFKPRFVSTVPVPRDCTICPVPIFPTKLSRPMSRKRPGLTAAILDLIWSNMVAGIRVELTLSTYLRI